MRIGITGQAGFVGWHLYQRLKLEENTEMIDFKRGFFDEEDSLANFVSKCDVIVHLAAMNRHEDPNVIYNTNVELVNKLIRACQIANCKPHILFSSSSQEEKDNLYGKSKKEGKRLFTEWAKQNQAKFTSLNIPNVFGPFGKPNYNSVVATFCHKIVNGEKPEIINDGNVGLIYVNDLVKVIIDGIKNPDQSVSIDENSSEIKIEPRHHIKVSQLLSKLEGYKEEYLENGVFPELQDEFNRALFNTFRCYVPIVHYPVDFTQHTDPRGSFVEITRAKTSGQFSYSTTVPGITRGNHFHTRKAERFAVIKGKAKIQLRKIGTNEVIDYFLDGNTPSYVDMPIWHTHNITNIGDEELLTLFWINEPYDPKDADTFFENV